MMNLSARVMLVGMTGFLVAPASACNSGAVRDAAFQHPRDVHVVCVFGNKADSAADATFKTMAAWLQGDGKDLNLTLERVAADDPDVQWAPYGIPSAPPNMPVVAMIGRFPSPPRAFVIDHWEPQPTAHDLAVLSTSPAREAIAAHVMDSFAVLLYSPGSSSARVETILGAVSDKWASEQPSGVFVVRFDRADPNERVLCAFAGIRSPPGPGSSVGSTPSPDWLGVVFGRGKLLAPPLEGDDITEDRINELLNSLKTPCTCLQESITIGLDVPMKWSADQDAKVAALSSPTGYMEMPLEAAAVQPQAPKTAVSNVDIERELAALAAQVPEEGNRVLVTAIVVAAAAALIACAVTSIAVWRFRRNRARMEAP